MNKEETISNLKAYLDGDVAIGNIIPLRSVLKSALEYLEPSLPSNLIWARRQITMVLIFGLGIRGLWMKQIDISIMLSKPVPSGWRDKE